MLPPPAVWEPRNPELPTSEAILHLRDSLRLPGPLAEILASRGLIDVAAAQRFLRPSLDQLLDPRDMADMPAAVALLVEALEGDELIALHGDYDADGITSTALVTDFLEAVGGRVLPFLPDRATDGYGLSERCVREAAERGAGLLVTLDCGTSDHETLALASELGLPTLVVDHHPVHEHLPESARAVLNPARDDCGFADRKLSAVGVAFYLLAALRRELRSRGWWRRRGVPEPNLRRSLDLVALGTVADVVPLVDQNRTLVAFGLDEIGRRTRPGVDALCSVARLGGRVTSAHVGYDLAPRLNASGRIGLADAGLQLLTSHDHQRARTLAQQLDEQNRRRRTIQQAIEAEAIAEVESGRHAGRPALVLAKEGWHPGVVGIVASRLVERYYVPAVVIGLQDGQGKGSARSVRGVDIGQAIRSCDDLIEAGGGHAMAAGVTLRAEAVEAFARALGERVAEATGGVRPVPQVRYDAELRLDQLTPDLVRGIEAMAPFGMGNPRPVLIARGTRLTRRRVFKGKHLGCTLRSDGVLHQAVGFGLAHKGPPEGAEVDVAFTVEFDQHRRDGSLRLKLKDVRDHKEIES